jgi:hypothetical protein
LTLRVVSRSGNGFDEQVIALATGFCESLPTVSALPENIFIIDGDTLVVGSALIPLGAHSPEVPLNAVPPRPENSQEVIDLLAGRLIVNTDNLSIRSGDGVEFTLLGIVDGGTVLIPLGRNDNFSWWYVQAGDIIGWAKAEFLIARGDLRDIPVVPSAGDITIPRFFLFTDIALLPTPAAGGLPLCNIPGDLEYLITGRTANANWYEIQTICNNVLVKGWVPADRGAVRNPAAVPIDVVEV